MTVLHEQIREFRDGGCLAHTINSGDQNHSWSRSGFHDRRKWIAEIPANPICAFQQIDHFVAYSLPDGINVDRSPSMISLQSCSDATSSRHTHVSADQSCFEILQQAVVQNLSGTKQVANIGSQNLFCFLEPTF